MLQKQLPKAKRDESRRKRHPVIITEAKGIAGHRNKGMPGSFWDLIQAAKSLFGFATKKPG